MKHLISVLLCLICSAAEQRADAQVNNNSVFQVMINSSFTNTGNSANARNIGQQYHLLTIRLTGAGTCVSTAPPSTGFIGLQASYDNVNFFPIGAPITVIYNGLATTSASGAYAYVRVSYSILFTGSVSRCNVNATYAGSITGTPTSSVPYTIGEDTFIYLGGVLGNSLALPITCAIPTAPQIYGLSLTATGGANTVSIEIENASSAIEAEYNVILPVTAPSFIWPQGPRPYFGFPNAASIGSTTHIFLALASSTEIDYAITFRCE